MSLDLWVITGERYIEEVLLFSELSKGTTDVRLEIVPLKAELLWGPHGGAASTESAAAAAPGNSFHIPETIQKWKLVNNIKVIVVDFTSNHSSYGRITLLILSL